MRVYQFRHRRSGAASIAALWVTRDALDSERMFALRRAAASSKEQTDGSDQAPAGDLRLHQALLGAQRLSADRSRHRQGRRSCLVLDRARASCEPREDRPAATRSDASRARSSCSTARRPGCAAWCGPACRSSGHVAAGQPVLAEENIEDYIATPVFAGGDDGEYLLRVRGESMKNAGILEGDLVVVRPQDTAADGDIVVALVGEEATVKRFFQEADHIRLQPENDDDGADQEPGGSHARQGRRADAEHLLTAAAGVSRAGNRARSHPRSGALGPAIGRARTRDLVRPHSAIRRARAGRSAAVARLLDRRYPDACRLSSRGGARLRGKSGHRRARWSVTPTRGNPRESATEKTPPKSGAAAEPQAGKGEMVR